MGNMILIVALLLVHLPTELLSIQVIVQETERRTMLFSSVILRCDYSTSAQTQDVLVTWRFKSFCKDPVLEYYSTAYQAALQLGQDPANDCPDSQRTVRVVAQKRGTNEATLSADYRNRKITIQNKADLVINEVMWWDNGVYFCAIDAVGDTTGDSDREVKLIVFHWLTVLLIILGGILLIILLAVCCCQCCPQKCCCYVRCPCCPQTCCCPEKGSYSDYPTKDKFAMAPMQLAPMALQHQPPAPPSLYQVDNSMQGSVQGTSQVLDYLENQVRGLDVVAPQMPPHPVQNMLPLQTQAPPPSVPFTPGPPSMLSALDGIGMRGVERRVITLPPIIQRTPSFTSHRGARGDGARGANRMSSQSSGSTNRSTRGLLQGNSVYRDVSPPRRGILRDYIDDSDWDNRRERSAYRGSRNDRGSSGRREGRSRPRARSRNDLLEELHNRPTRRERSYSPPQNRKGAWSSDEDDSRRKKEGKGKDWPEKPPSYYSIDIHPARNNGRRNYDRFSDRSSRSSTSVVI
ncbi:immunoglobulin-like domain-containing receptor 1 isoform 2-T2 [Pholidichthys leucotaenia]